MSHPLLDELMDSDPRLQAIEDEPSSPQRLAHDAAEPATVAFVVEALRVHRGACPAPRKLHRWTKIACVGIGIVLCLQLLIAGLGRSYLRDTVRTVLREEMGRTVAVDQPAWTPLVPSAFAETKGSPTP